MRGTPPRGDAVVTLVHSHCVGILRPGVAGREGGSGDCDAVRSPSGGAGDAGWGRTWGGGSAGQSQFLWDTKHLAHALREDLE